MRAGKRGANSTASDASEMPATTGLSLYHKLSALQQWVPSYAWQRLTRRSPRGRVHLVFALADHFEPAIVPHDGKARAPYQEQEARVESWCRDFPEVADAWRDNEGFPFVHSYFFPAEQYDEGLVGRLAQHCHEGWGEIEVHLHHGIPDPDTPENTRQSLLAFRDILALRHGCLSYRDGLGSPCYAFVHGNFALANSAGGRFCGVDEEMAILAETGCFADLSMPTAMFHPAQIAKINSIYECGLPLHIRAPHRRGVDLVKGRAPATLPILIQGPLGLKFQVPPQGGKWVKAENGAVTGYNPLSMSRLQIWKRANITVAGRPDWLFIKLYCHSMDPTQHDAVVGQALRDFLRELVQGASTRNEILHFVTAREMTNIILAACNGREGNPGDYRDYRFQRRRTDQQRPMVIPINTVVKA